MKHILIMITVLTFCCVTAAVATEDQAVADNTAKEITVGELADVVDNLAERIDDVEKLIGRPRGNESLEELEKRVRKLEKTVDDIEKTLSKIERNIDSIERDVRRIEQKVK
ncbi:MAG: hypothetical protein KJ626_09615 [Verrucomicrobia bacterium]|nr:hypothetical protein [Verrucomicrobiota bacterium]